MCRSRSCRSCSPRSTPSSGEASSLCCPRMPTRAMPPRRRGGSSVRRPWRSSPHEACISGPASNRLHISSANARALSRCSSAAGSSARRREPSPKDCLRPRFGRRHFVSPAATSLGSRPWSSISRLQATNASNASRSAVSSPCAAGSSTCSARRVASRCASSSSATRSSRCASSHPSRSGRSGRSTRPSSIRRPNAAERASSRTSGRRRTTVLSLGCRTTSCHRSAPRPTSCGSSTK